MRRNRPAIGHPEIPRVSVIRQNCQSECPDPLPREWSWSRTVLAIIGGPQRRSVFPMKREERPPPRKACVMLLEVGVAHVYWGSHGCGLGCPATARLPRLSPTHHVIQRLPRLPMVTTSYNEHTSHNGHTSCDEHAPLPHSARPLQGLIRLFQNKILNNPFIHTNLKDALKQTSAMCVRRGAVPNW